MKIYSDASLSDFLRKINENQRQHFLDSWNKERSKRERIYIKLTAELEELHKKQKALQSEELLKAIADSERSFEEIMNYIRGKNEED